MGPAQVLSLAGRLASFGRALKRLHEGGAEMTKVLDSTIRRSLCPDDPANPAVRQLARTILENFWEQVEMKGSAPSRNKVLARFKRVKDRLTGRIDPRYTSYASWRVDLEKAVCACVSTKDLRYLRAQIDCYEAPRDAGKFAEHFPALFLNELNMQVSNPKAYEFRQALRDQLEKADRRNARTARDARNAALAMGATAAVSGAVAVGAVSAAGGDVAAQVVTGAGVAAIGATGAAVAASRRAGALLLREQANRFARTWLRSLRTATTHGLDEDPKRTEALIEHLRGSLLTTVQAGGDSELYLQLLELTDLLGRRRYDPTADLELEATIQRAEDAASEHERRSVDGAAEDKQGTHQQILPEVDVTPSPARRGAPRDRSDLS